MKKFNKRRLKLYPKEDKNILKRYIDASGIKVFKAYSGPNKKVILEVCHSLPKSEP